MTLQFPGGGNRAGRIPTITTARCGITRRSLYWRRRLNGLFFRGIMLLVGCSTDRIFLTVAGKVRRIRMRRSSRSGRCRPGQAHHLGPIRNDPIQPCLNTAGQFGIRCCCECTASSRSLG